MANLVLGQPAELKVHALFDLWAFIELLKYQGGTSKFGDIHFEFCQWLQRPQKTLDVDEFQSFSRRLAELPRGYLKSTLLIAYILWRVYRNPQIRIIYGTNIKDLSQSFIRELRQYLENPDLQLSVWNNRPHIRGRLVPILDRSNRRWLAFDGDDTEAFDRKVAWNNQMIQVVRPVILKEPTVFATSTGTRVTGHHYDLIILDDIVDFQNSTTLSNCEKVRLWADDFENVINKKPRLVEFPPIYDNAKPFKELVGDEIIYCGTHYDPNDYWTYLENNKEEFRINTFIRNIYVNGFDNSDGYNWPQHMNEKMEAYLRRRLKDLFYPQYLNIVTAKARSFFNWDKIVWFPESKINVSKQGYYGFVPVEKDGEVLDVRLNIVVDPAASLETTACDTSIVVGGVDKNYELYIFELVSDKLTPTQTCKILYDMVLKWKHHVVTIETVGYQLALRHTVLDYFKSKATKVVIRDYLPRGDKLKRIESWLEPHFQDSTLNVCETIRNNTTFEQAVKFFGSSVRIDTLDVIAILREIAFPGRRVNPTSPSSVVPFRPVNKKWGGIYA